MAVAPKTSHPVPSHPPTFPHLPFSPHPAVRYSAVRYFPPPNDDERLTRGPVVIRSIGAALLLRHHLLPAQVPPYALYPRAQTPTPSPKLANLKPYPAPSQPFAPSAPRSSLRMLTVLASPIVVATGGGDSEWGTAEQVVEERVWRQLGAGA